MHCIFAGARGLFLDRLVRDTSAEVVVPEPGRLRLLGRAEPVVMAQSRIQQFVALFQVWCQIVWKGFCLKYCFGFLSRIYFDYYYVHNYKAIIYQWFTYWQQHFLHFLLYKVTAFLVANFRALPRFLRWKSKREKRVKRERETSQNCVCVGGWNIRLTEDHFINHLVSFFLNSSMFKREKKRHWTVFFVHLFPGEAKSPRWQRAGSEASLQVFCRRERW